MTVPRASWSLQQLAEFLGGLPFVDEESVIRAAVERAAEALEAEIGAFVQQGAIAAAIGFPADAVPEQDLVAVADGGLDEITIAGLGVARPAVVPLENGELGGRIVVARLDEGGFSAEELNLLRAMARVLAQRLEAIGLIERERTLAATLEQRGRLLEETSAIQRAILRRAPLQDVLDAIVKAAGDLIGDEVAALRLIDSEDETATVSVAMRGVPGRLVAETERGRIGEGVGGRAIQEDRLVVIEQYEESPEALPGYAADGLGAAMACPVHEKGAVVGSLTVASYEPSRTYSADEQATLVAFAEHASLALMDAKTVDAMAHQALHDALTGLPNRALFLDRLEHSLARAEREHGLVALLFVDLDGFKGVNDRLGHEAGDALLVAVGERLAHHVRGSDTTARLGGDEFAILMESLERRSDAARLAERVVEALRQPFMVEGKEIFVSASIGIAFGSERQEDLLRNADLAMYRAKSQSKGRYEFFEPGMRAEVLDRLELEADLARAVEREELLLHYQPIVRLAGSQPYALEALVRWRHPERGLLPPLEFIPLAEETGAIVGIGRWVLAEACRRISAWQCRHPSEHGLSLSVNLSGRQLQQPDLVDNVAAALADADLAPHRLILEITETVLMDDTEATIRRLRALKQLGVQIAVDDFGTGYSSLRYLKRFPLDILKVAKPFVDGVGRNPEDTALTQAIVSLGDTFGLDVVAEGIERTDQMEEVRRLGCTLGQGFLFARPADAESVPSLLNGSRAAPVGVGV